MNRTDINSASYGDFDEYRSMEDGGYREPNSLHISDDWDTLMEDFLDDFEDYQDVDFPKPDEDY